MVSVIDLELHHSIVYTITMKCSGCGKQLGLRNKTGVCQKCPRPKEWRDKTALSKIGDKNVNWKGDQPILNSMLHRWVRRWKPKQNFCNSCKQVSLKLDLANISDKPNTETYTRDFKNWNWLCRRCHMLKDGRMERIHSKETYRKISLALKGRIFSPATLAKMSASSWNKGKKWPEHSARMKGRIPWNKGLKKKRP